MKQRFQWPKTAQLERRKEAISLGQGSYVHMVLPIPVTLFDS